ncbi:uncharacterized protein EMH_0089030 [Eimeria mitis]|uniref:Secreted protein n=1 Tax=Eimeria mitis TaxID=44415 RepID=U6KDD4_9EIME|nr:uncharacterized protein EMH_0089030 [Eimeria mitis]CDJ34262.1 hypothetical protein EMH_0089030 [Eimeria mitis]
MVEGLISAAVALLSLAAWIAPDTSDEVAGAPVVSALLVALLSLRSGGVEETASSLAVVTAEEEYLLRHRSCCELEEKVLRL